MNKTELLAYRHIGVVAAHTGPDDLRRRKVRVDGVLHEVVGQEYQPHGKSPMRLKLRLLEAASVEDRRPAESAPGVVGSEEAQAEPGELAPSPEGTGIRDEEAERLVRLWNICQRYR